MAAGWWTPGAGRRLDEVAEATGIELPGDDDYDTMAGLIVDRLGRFPAMGDRLTLDMPDGGRAVIDARTLDRHVPDRVRLERLPVREREEERSRRQARTNLGLLSGTAIVLRRGQRRKDHDISLVAGFFGVWTPTGDDAQFGPVGTAVDLLVRKRLLVVELHSVDREDGCPPV